MKGEIKLCPNNFKVWVAFLMGMVVIVIAIVVFDKASNGRLGLDNRLLSEDVVDQKIGGLPQDVTADGNTQLTSGGEDSSTWLGIEVNDISEKTAEQMGLDISEGVLVSRVIPDSPADQAGILPGDILFEFDHRDVDDVDKLVKLVSKAEPGDRAKLSLIRDDDRIVVYVELEDSVDQQTLAATKSAGTAITASGELLPSDGEWGIVLSELTDQLGKQYDIPEDMNGVLVMMVIQGSPAARAGVRKGDLIRQVDRARITSLTDFFKSLEGTGQTVVLYVYRDDTALLIQITAPASTSSGAVSVAQEGIGMNRPLYVPGYDQTQSGDPDDKTKTTSDPDSTQNSATTRTTVTESSFL